MKELKGPGKIYKLEVKRKSKKVRRVWIKDGNIVLMMFTIPSNEKWNLYLDGPVYYMNTLTYGNCLTVHAQV